MHEEIHAGWLFASYDYMTGAEGRKCIFKGWEKAGVTEISLFTVPLFLRGILETGTLSGVVKASAISGECLNYRGEPEWALLSGGGGAKKYPLPSVDNLPRSRSRKMATAPSKRTSLDNPTEK